MLNRLDLRGRTGAALTAGLPRPDPGGEGPVAAVQAIVADVRARGDEALREYTERFDGVACDTFLVPADEVQAALDAAPAELVDVIRLGRTALARASHD